MKSPQGLSLIAAKFDRLMHCPIDQAGLPPLQHFLRFL
jgi:hypothetical protein